MTHFSFWNVFVETINFMRSDICMKIHVLIKMLILSHGIEYFNFVF